MIRLIASFLTICYLSIPHCCSAEALQDDLLPAEKITDVDVDEDNELIVDRDHDRGRDERRNLYEENRDRVKRDAHEKARHLQLMRNRQDGPQQINDEASQMQQPYYYYPQ